MNPRLCQLGDPESDIYNAAYEEYLKDTPKPDAPQAFTPAPVAQDPPPGYTPGILQKIEDCPHRSVFQHMVDENKMYIRKHTYKDGTPAEGCGCGKMKCRLGKGVNGDVDLEDCKACINEQESIEKPSLLDKVASVTKAVVKHVASGLPSIPDLEKQRRLDICGKCVHNDGGTCRVCGCVLSVKTSLPNEKCPLPSPRWDVYEIKAGE
jgi:hypothetical protein